MENVEKKWYVVNTYSGHENKVKINLERRIEKYFEEVCLIKQKFIKNPDVTIEELLNENLEGEHKQEYYKSIVETIIEIDRAKEFIIAISKVIQKLVVDRLHVIGDIYDRGPRPDIVLDRLMDYHSVDIQWGNHDILWMGAAAGEKTCIANALRISARYANLDILEVVETRGTILIVSSIPENEWPEQ